VVLPRWPSMVQTKELIVMKPSPPAWISSRITSWPNQVKEVPGSTGESPVVETAETATNRTSSGETGVSWANGSDSSAKPSAICPA
jgi:hypothetical protein